MTDSLRRAARRELAQFSEGASTLPREALRARLVLATLDGGKNNEVAEEFGVSPPTVALWRRRYDAEGLRGLRDRPRSGRPRIAASSRIQRAHQRPPQADHSKTKTQPPDESTPLDTRIAGDRQAVTPEVGTSTDESLSDVTLQRFLEAASTTIAQRGFGATRVADIAREVGVSPATVHYYFKTKEEILERALLWANARLMSRLETSDSESDDPLVRLAQFIERTIPFSGVRREEYLLEIDLWSRIRLHPKLLPPWEAFADRWNAHLTELIREGVNRGRFRPIADPDEIVERLTALTDGLAAQSVIGSKRMPPVRAREIVLRFAAEQLGVDYAALEQRANLPDI